MGISLLRSSASAYQNPALVSLLLFYFIEEFFSRTSSPCSIEILYYITPLILIDDYFSELDRTLERSGLEKFVSKFVKKKKRDKLYRLESEVERFAELTTQAIYIGVACGLLYVEKKDATVSPKKSGIKLPRTPHSFKVKLKQASKLGFWFSKKTPFDALATLRMGEI